MQAGTWLGGSASKTTSLEAFSEWDNELKKKKNEE